MLPKTLIKSLDKRRLRGLLGLLFLGLAVPTVVLIWQGYSQLKWEAFHQHRGAAEELTRRVDSNLGAMIRMADARTFADYTFLVVSGDPSANFVQRSPLSTYPAMADVPGVLGYFQVDTEGTFSTPLLPPAGADAGSFGISAAEYSDRLQLARELQSILADNRLVRPRSEMDALRGLASSAPAAVATVDEDAEEVADKTDGLSRDRQAAVEESLYAGRAAEPAEQAAASETYSQAIFDRLNQPASDGGLSGGSAGEPGFDDAEGEISEVQQRLNRVEKVSELKLDAALQKKSEAVENEGDRSAPGSFAFSQSRAKRKETIALPEAAAPAGSELIRNVGGITDLRISTFESEVDPLEFSLLDSGHFVLFRKVWRNGERYIQGFLIDQNALVRNSIGEPFLGTTLADMSSLIVAYEDDVIRTFDGRDSSGLPYFAEDLDNALLYRSRLTTPLNSLELIFSINRLAPGAGAGVLGWVTLVLAVVFIGGFMVLYRLGLSQINLARQQQDFVSAVSHELKTPLTSIRMYGEMLKEGWADEDKRQSYYEYIHDESERLSRLISNVLELARITRNEPQFDLQPATVAELLSNIESKISSQVERAGFELRFVREERSDQATINIDQDCFAQIIINLVDNAIKFSRDADQKIIEIGSRLTGNNEVLFSVRDYGPGIPKDQMQKIFELFYRSESELTRETVGTGIGLAIVHQLTLAMDGSVDMVNVEPGAEFRLRFEAA